ncbi:hypothetical protein [Modestobacter lapidis]|nr:hypothetical protein [Modestobacter lapidis]
MTRVLAHAEKVGLANTEEFTFRASFMSAAHDRLGCPRFQTEWRKFDLLVQDGDVATLIEFKYYLLRRSHDLDGVPGRLKGGAGPKNEAEFSACLAKLRNSVVPGIGARRLVLVYERDDEQPRLRTLHRSYGGLAPSGSIARVWRVAVGPLEARVLEPTDPAPGSGTSPAAELPGGEDAAALWADGRHAFDLHPDRPGVCVLCLGDRAAAVHATP